MPKTKSTEQDAKTDYSNVSMIDLKESLSRRNIKHDLDAPRKTLIDLLEKADAAFPEPIEEATAKGHDDPNAKDDDEDTDEGADPRGAAIRKAVQDPLPKDDDADDDDE